jgi:hypothetical protein
MLGTRPGANAADALAGMFLGTGVPIDESRGLVAPSGQAACNSLATLW